MSIFSDISGLMGAASGGPATGNAMPDEAKGQIANVLDGVLKNQGVGGISGMLQQFEQSGLGAQAASWVGGGANQPVSAGHIEQVLGPSVLGAIASRFGIDPGQASQMLSQHLPGIVDHMTPNGTVPDTNVPDTNAASDTASDDDTPDDAASDDTGNSR
jgi:uncharacterized protein YidB (DUF937 family)